MRRGITCLNLENVIVHAHALLDEMFREADQFTTNENHRQQAIREHLSAALEDARLLSNSLLQRADSAGIFEMADRPQLDPTPKRSFDMVRLGFSNTRHIDITPCEWKDLQTAIRTEQHQYGCFDGVMVRLGFSNTRHIDITPCEWKDLQTAIRTEQHQYGCFDGADEASPGKGKLRITDAG